MSAHPKDSGQSKRENENHYIQLPVRRTQIILKMTPIRYLMYAQTLTAAFRTEDVAI